MLHICQVKEILVGLVLVFRVLNKINSQRAFPNFLTIIPHFPHGLLLSFNHNHLILLLEICILPPDMLKTYFVKNEEVSKAAA